MKHNTAKKTGPDTETPLRTLVGAGGGQEDPDERLLHERMRLAIMSALAVNPSLSFSDMKSILEISDGNLSVHARKLEEAGYIVCDKTFENRVPKTTYKLTSRGRTALEKYLGHLEAVIRAVKKKQ